MKRTGSIGSLVPPAVTSTLFPASSPSLPSTILIVPIISLTSASLPFPILPEASLPYAGPTITTPLSRSVERLA